MAHVSGHFTAFFSATSGSGGTSFVGIGSTREGFRIRQRNYHQPVIDDRGGEAEVDGIQQGTDVTVECDYIDYDLIVNAIWGNGTTGAQNFKGKLYDNVGLRLVDLAGVLKLTPVAGTPAATEAGTGNSYYFYKTIVDEDTEILLASKLRQGPLRFRCFPDPTTSDKVWEVKT